MSAVKLFRPEDLEAIKTAVGEAERRTAGEIVPFVVAASDDYAEAPWRGATLGALLGAMAAALVHELGGLWGGWFAAWVILPPLGGAVAGYVASTFLAPVRRALLDTATLEGNVRRRAEQAFLSEEVFATRDRTGILIFLSLFEHRVLVLADSGISSVVAQDEWDSIVARIIAGVRAGRPTESLIEGISACGRLLERRGVDIKPGDVDELSDALRTRDR